MSKYARLISVSSDICAEYHTSKCINATLCQRFLPVTMPDFSRPGFHEGVEPFIRACVEFASFINRLLSEAISDQISTISNSFVI